MIIWNGVLIHIMFCMVGTVETGFTKNRTKVFVFDFDNNIVDSFSSIRECGRVLNLDRHKIARVLKGELPKNYLGYYFSYFDNRQETIENIA